MRLQRALGLFITVTLTDVFLTLRGLAERGEGNPIIRFYMDWIGPVPGLVLFKTVVVGGALFLLICAARRGGKIESILHAGTGITLLLSSMWLV